MLLDVGVVRVIGTLVAMLRRRSLALAVAALVVLGPLAACSNDGETTEAGSGTSSSTSTSSTVSTIPDLGEVAGPVGDCLTAAGEFTNLVQGLLQGADGAKRSQTAAEELKTKLPPELQDDAEVLALYFGKIAASKGGALDPAVLQDPAYAQANAAIGAYFNEKCGAG